MGRRLHIWALAAGAPILGLMWTGLNYHVAQREAASVDQTHRTASHVAAAAIAPLRDESRFVLATSASISLVLLIGMAALIRELELRRSREETLGRAYSALRESTEELRVAKESSERARVQAAAAAQAKSDFLAAMSHEIRTPLHSLIGFADLIAVSGRLPPDLGHYAGLMRSSGSALLALVDDILDLSKIEAGAIELEHRPFAPATLVDHCISIIRAGIGRKGIALSVDLGNELPPSLVGDEARVRQILLNLLHNAVKFTRAGSVTLMVRHEGPEGAGERLRFAVTDTGIGIATEKKHRLFERFSQVDDSIRRDFGGTGLGLSICKRLVGVMGGDIGVVSEEGQGSTFWFTLTLPRANVQPRPADTASDGGQSALNRGRLLLVEDVAINQELGRLVLRAAGHTVDVVESGAEAVRAVAEDGPYDLVLMDVQMPGMDGMEATTLIRMLDGPACHTPIVAMTANVLPEQVARFHAAGMDDHIGKPFDARRLYETIDRWIGESSVAPVRLDRRPAAEEPLVLRDRLLVDPVAGCQPPQARFTMLRSSPAGRRGAHRASSVEAAPGCGHFARIRELGVPTRSPSRSHPNRPAAAHADVPASTTRSRSLWL